MDAIAPLAITDKSGDVKNVTNGPPEETIMQSLLGTSSNKNALHFRTYFTVDMHNGIFCLQFMLEI